MVRWEDEGWGSALCFMAATPFHPSHSREMGPCCQKGPERTNRAQLHPLASPSPCHAQSSGLANPKDPQKGADHHLCVMAASMGACAQAAAILQAPQDLQPLLGARAWHKSGTVGATMCGSGCPGQGLCVPGRCQAGRALEQSPGDTTS